MCSCGCNCGPGAACFIVEPVLDPVIAPPSQSFTSSLTVTITCPTQNAVIHYTTDGTTPTASSTVYTGPFIISDTAKVKAIALLQYFSPSNVVSQTYTKVVPAGTVYWGPASNPMLTGPEVLLLQSAYETDPYRTYSFPATSTVNDYFYFWWPTFFGPPKSGDGFRDLSNLMPIVMATSAEGFNTNIENGWWYKEVIVNGIQGKLFRSFYQLGGGGAFPIEVLPPTTIVYHADTIDLTSDLTSYTADYS